jgi:hypothetical protein
VTSGASAVDSRFTFPAANNNETDSVSMWSNSNVPADDHAARNSALLTYNIGLSKTF